MPRWNGFGRSLVFAALAAAATPALWLALGPLVGRADALSLVWLGGAALYAFGIAPAPGLRRGLAASAGVLVLGALLSTLAATPLQVAAAAALSLALVRSAFLYRARALRAIALETALGIGGLLLARFALGAAWGLPDPLAAGFAVWAYFLIQSCFFLVVGARARTPGPNLDPFDRAQARLLTLLEE